MFSSGKHATVRGRKPHCRELWLEAGEAGRGESGIRYHVMGIWWVTSQRPGLVVFQIWPPALARHLSGQVWLLGGKYDSVEEKEKE